MKFFLISDKIDTLTGMRLAGINGVFVREREELLKTLDDACATPEIGIILITENLSFMIPDEIHDIRIDKKMPIISIIPDRHGSQRPDDYITNYIKESIGIKI
jgi:V/A-type H+-transporting ATPase subunit F